MYDNTLPSTSYGDGPPYSEDEDLHSPILITTRRRKSRGGEGPGGEYDPERGIFVSNNGDGTETYYVPDEDTIEDGPGGEYVTYDDWPEDDSRLSRDFHFAITSPDEEMHGKAIALFDFQSMHENELPLHEGQVILVSYRHGEGWLVAEDPKSGESGLVPEAYVRLARHIEGGLNSLNEEQEQEQEQADSELENRRNERESVGEKALQHQDDGLDENEKQPADGDEKYQQQPPHQPQPQDEPHHNNEDGTNNPPKTNEERRVEADDPSLDDNNGATH
ncbi:HOG (high osmolarity glycerol) pathway protein [Ascosphaera atra]|nr:HOG (high osmolarity glycerol) pathway protein [Ascosphaera atra]